MKITNPTAGDELIAGISASPIATVVTDPRLPNNPIVAINDAFTALTGYSEAEVIGRNCRFLAGAGTEPWASEALRNAVKDGRAAFAELLNYRKDGTPFLNAVMIAPRYDDNGELEYFIGSQMDVKDAGPPIARRQRSGERIRQLTPRQIDVLRLMAAGLRNKQIAERLSLSEKTVKMHRAALLTNLDVATSADAVRIAVEAGL